MKATSFATMLYIFLVMVVQACDSSRPDHTEEAPSVAPSDAIGPISVTDNERFAAYVAPAMVLIQTKTDSTGQDIPGTAEMRLLANTVDRMDALSLSGAFTQGMPAPTLNAGQPVRWDTYQSAGQLGQYSPRSYIGSGANQGYQYAAAGQYSQGNSRWYAYQQPRPVIYGPPSGPMGPGGPRPMPSPSPTQSLDQDLTKAMAPYEVSALESGSIAQASREMIDLGGRLFTERALSTSGDIACVTCHTEQRGTSNGLSLSPTAIVLGGRKTQGFTVNDLLARNAPALFNLAHPDVKAMFWDGRVSIDGSSPNGYRTPAGDLLPKGLSNLLAVQALFPLIAPAEMGCGRDAQANSSTDPRPKWDAVVKRVLAKSEYKPMLAAAYPGISTYDISHIVNAIAAFEASRWQTGMTPFDRYLGGDLAALTPEQKAGASYFYGKADCARCHSGALFSDQGFHASGVPQFGPGMGEGALGMEDFGWERVTGQASDRYKFRTPSLRNVALSGPWGHDGAYGSLRDMVAHYTNSSAPKWSARQAVLPPGYNRTPIEGAWASEASRRAVGAASTAGGVQLSPQEIDAIVAFLNALTDVR